MPISDRPRRRIRVLINPSARSGRGPRALAALRQEKESQADSEFEWIETRSADHFCALVQEAQNPRADLHVLAVAGGDGTVTLAIDALAALHQRGTPQRVPLSVLPIGSGNDFAHDIGASRDLATAFAALTQGTPHWVDVGAVASLPGTSTQPESPHRRFCCVASVGLDELALRRIHASPFRRSKALNIYAALRGLLEYRPRALSVRWQGGEFHGDVMFCAVTNTRSYGGGFHVSPDARIDDGLLDLCIVPRMEKPRLLSHFPRILRGTHGRVPGIVLAQSPWIQLSTPSDAPLPLCIDGELPSGATPVELRCIPRSLLMLTPQRTPHIAPWKQEAA